MREKSDEIATVIVQSEEKEKGLKDELQSQEQLFKGEMDKVNDAVGALRRHVAELEQTEKDLNAELETKARESELVIDGKDKDIQRLSETFKQAEETIAMMKETEERTLRDHATTLTTQQTLHKTYVEKTDTALETRQSTIDDLGSQLADARKDLTAKLETITTLEESEA